MRRWIGLALVTSAVGVTCAVAAAGAALSIPVQAAAASKATVWLQTLDACRQAVPGATFTLSGHNVSQDAGPGAGTKTVTVDPTQQCPLQQGDCTTVATGCVSWSLPVPAPGSTSYVIRQSTAPTGYVGCTGGAACRDQFVQLTVDSTGTVSATVTNIYPDGSSVVWPSSGSYPATKSDPIIFHDFGVGGGSCGSSPSSHCSGTSSTTPASSSAKPATTSSSASSPSPSPSASPTSAPATTASATPASVDPPAAAPANPQAVVQPSIPMVPLPQPSFSEPTGMSGTAGATGVSALSLPTMPPMPTFPPMAASSSVPAPSAAAPATTGTTGNASTVSPNLAAAGTGTTSRDSVELLAVALTFTLVLVGGAVALRSRLLRHRSSD